MVAEDDQLGGFEFDSQEAEDDPLRALEFESREADNDPPRALVFESQEETEPGTESQEPLIPGLVDDLALSCLLRLSLPEQAVARSVCRSWRREISNRGYLNARRALSLAEPWLFVFAFHKVSGKIQWQALDRRRRSYHVIPAMPCKKPVCPPGFGCAAIGSAGVLLVCGGLRSDIECPMDTCLKYETFSNRWTPAARMGTARSFFASAAIDGRVYAAGGSSADSFDLSSAEAYDHEDDTWRPIACMGANMARYDAAVLDGKLHVTEGWSWPFHFSPRGQIYDPVTNRWENMSLGMREGWTGLSVVLGNFLFIIPEHGNSRLKFYDGKSDSWKYVSGSPMPTLLQRPFSVNSIDGVLYVVGRGLHVAVGTVTRLAGEVVSVEWDVIMAPQGFDGFVPSNSQVLYA